MGYGASSDSELMELSQVGVAPAFAVLLHRHGPAVRSAVREDPAPTDAVIEVFVRAMRELPDRDPSLPVRPWLLGLAGSAETPDPIVPLGEDERDEIWAELAVRWPSGRPPRHREALQRVALIAGLIAISALVPTLVLLAGQSPTEPPEELRAFPLQTSVAVDDEEREPLPSFTFPTVPELEEPAPVAPEPTWSPTPIETASPTPSPAPSPTPTETEGPPEPVEEPAPEPEPEPTETEPVEQEPVDPPATLPTEPPSDE